MQEKQAINILKRMSSPDTQIKDICFAGSDSENSNGWYRIASQTMSGYGNSNVIFSVMSTYMYGYSGLLSLHVRSNKTSIYIDQFAWISRIGFDPKNFIVTINGMQWNLYAYQESPQYGRIFFEVLSKSTISSQINRITFYSNYPKLESKPITNVRTSVDVGITCKANRLTTARTISLKGSVTGSISFDGSSDVVINTTTNHTHNYLPLNGGNLNGRLVAIQNGNKNTNDKDMYYKSNIEVRCTDGGYPSISFHRLQQTALTLYHKDNTEKGMLRIVRHDGGGDYTLYHEGNRQLLLYPLLDHGDSGEQNEHYLYVCRLYTNGSYCQLKLTLLSSSRYRSASTIHISTGTGSVESKLTEYSIKYDGTYGADFIGNIVTEDSKDYLDIYCKMKTWDRVYVQPLIARAQDPSFIQWKNTLVLKLPDGKKVTPTSLTNDAPVATEKNPGIMSAEMVTELKTLRKQIDSLQVAVTNFLHGK